MSAHTSGPWELDDNDIRSGGELLATAYPMDCDLDTGDRYATARANARLIAAAPDLLEACKAMTSCAGDGSASFNTARKMARAAIAKAEGRL